MTKIKIYGDDEPKPEKIINLRLRRLFAGSGRSVVSLDVVSESGELISSILEVSVDGVRLTRYGAASRSGLPMDPANPNQVKLIAS